jgi:hypothetical protein
VDRSLTAAPQQPMPYSFRFHHPRAFAACLVAALAAVVGGGAAAQPPDTSRVDRTSTDSLATRADTSAAHDALDAEAFAADAPFGSWRCTRRAPEGQPPSELTFELRPNGRWADRSGPRAISARYEWDAPSRTLTLLSAGGSPLHTLRLEKKSRLVGDGVSCRKLE